MKINHFSWDTDYQFNWYDEDKPLYLGHSLNFFFGHNAENYFSWGHPRKHKERKLNKNKNSVQLANTFNKRF